MNLVVLVALVVTVMLSIDPVLTLFALLPLLHVLGHLLHLCEHSPQERRSPKGPSRVSASCSSTSRAFVPKASTANATRAVRRRDGRVQSPCARPGEGGSHVHAAHRLVGLSTILTIYVGGQRGGRPSRVGHIFQLLLCQPADLAFRLGRLGDLVGPKAEASMNRILDFLDATPAVTSQTRRTQDGCRPPRPSNSTACVDISRHRSRP